MGKFEGVRMMNTMDDSNEGVYWKRVEMEKKRNKRLYIRLEMN